MSARFRAGRLASERLPRYPVARYDAYSCVYLCDLANEYEYVTGEYRHTPVACR